ncbi:MAG: ubiquinol-cytochrome C chaperone family protein [Cucumibacter sp.]
MLALFRKDRLAEAALAVYTPIVAQSRHPGFYAEWGVADTPTGRFMMISLHMALALRRLRSEPEASRFSQALFDLFFRDMDRSLREMGVGDLSIGKRIAGMTELFYGLLSSVGSALDADDSSGLAASLSRNLFDFEPNAAAKLAAYCQVQSDTLAAQPAGAILAGELRFETLKSDA